MDLQTKCFNSHAAYDTDGYSELVTGVESSITAHCRTDNLAPHADRLLQVPVQESEPCSNGVIVLAHRDIPVKRTM